MAAREHASVPESGALQRWGVGGYVRAAGMLFLALGASFLTVTMLAASIAPGYDFHSAAISDLGVIDETALLFNALLVVVGALNIAGGFLYHRLHRRRLLLATYLVAGIGAIGAGLLPLSTGDAHAMFALTAFVFFNAQALGTAGVLRGLPRLLAAAAGVVGLAYTGLMIVGDGGNPAVFGSIGHGGSERMIAYPVMLWLLTFGGYLMGYHISSASRLDPRASTDH